jgi:ubiquitin-protein ligase
MVDSLKNRINKEYEDLKKSEKENLICVDMVDNDIRHWKGSIKGPVSYSKIKPYFMFYLYYFS